MFDALTDRPAPFGADGFDGDRRDTFVVGTLCTLATLTAPVAGVLLLGYAVRAIRRRAAGDGVPAFDDWRALAADGLRVALAAGPFHLPAAAVVATVGHGRMLRAPASLGSLGYGLSPDYVGLAAVIAAAILELAAAYLSVATLVAFARADAPSVRCAMRAVTVARDRRFVRAFGVVLAVGFAAGVARAVAGLLPFVGVALGAFASFAAIVVTASTLADAAATGDDPLASPGAESVDESGERRLPSG